MGVLWLVRRGANVSGPVSTETLKERAASGILRPTDELSQSGQTNWVQASSVRGLFPQENNLASPPPSWPLTTLQQPSANSRSQTTPFLSGDTTIPAVGKPPSSQSPRLVSKPPTRPQRDDVEDEDEFIADVVARATAARQQPPALPGKPAASGLVLAKDADGFTRLMDANLVSEDAVVERAAVEVKCPGCNNYHDDNEQICPHCFRQRGQSAQVLSTLISFIVTGACIVLGILGVQLLIATEIPATIKFGLALLASGIISGGLLWLKKSYGF